MNMDEKDKKNNFKMLFLFIGLFVLKILVILFFEKKIPGDVGEYKGYAHAILKSAAWLVEPGFTGSFRAPGYPLFLAVIYRIFGAGNDTAVFIAQALVSTITIYFIFALTQAMFDRTTAFIAAVWAGLYGFYFYYSTVILRETLVIFLFFMFWYYFYRFGTGKPAPVRKYYIYSVIFYALLIHTDERYLGYLPFLLPVFAAFFPVKKAVRQWFAFLCLTAVLMAPWTIRNAIAYKKLVIINDRCAVVHVENNKLLSAGIIPFVFSEPFMYRENRSAIHETYPPVNNFAKRIARRFVAFWQIWTFAGIPSAYFDNVIIATWSLRHNLFSMFFEIPVLIGFGLAFFFYKKQNRKDYIYLLFPVCTQTAIHAVVLGHHRYRVPIMAFMIILASFGLSALARVIAKRFWRTNTDEGRY